MKFEWNESKNLLNKQKHHISFETATHIFEDPYYIELYDFEHSEDEDRYIAIGKFRNVLFPRSNEPSSRACTDIWRLPRGSNTPYARIGVFDL